MIDTFASVNKWSFNVMGEITTMGPHRMRNPTPFCSRANDFRCADGSACIAATLWCDSYYDCRDFSDEQNCFG